MYYKPVIILEWRVEADARTKRNKIEPCAGVARVPGRSAPDAAGVCRIFGAGPRLRHLCAVAGSVDRAGPHAGEDAFRHHALRECAGLERFGHSPLQGPDLQGRSGDCHASGHYALLYDDPRGVPSGHGGRHDVDGQSDLRLRHGRIG